ncbi:DUF1186 domain-containing protein [candidate division KSB1 bacterium]|nr:DUF1186 domain-containing protein [candidate division KSB1 bacterium]
MTTTSYPSPVDKLLTFGDCSKFQKWPNYLELGFGAEHVGDLIRMMTDEALNTADSESMEVWAPIHAMRTLGQLRAEAAIQPIIGLFNRTDASDNYAVLSFPIVMSMIGPAAISALTTFISDPANGMYPRTYAGDCLAEIGRQHPVVREECIQSLVAVIEDFEKNDPSLNGFLIANFLDLGAVEAAPVMERAFAADCVDETIAGDWEDVQVDLGLLAARKTMRQYSLWKSTVPKNSTGEEILTPPDPSSSLQKQRNKTAKQKLKNKRAMAAKSRRLNRKKKK